MVARLYYDFYIHVTKI